MIYLYLLTYSQQAFVCGSVWTCRWSHRSRRLYDVQVDEDSADCRLVATVNVTVCTVAASQYKLTIVQTTSTRR